MLDGSEEEQSLALGVDDALVVRALPRLIDQPGVDLVVGIGDPQPNPTESSESAPPLWTMPASGSLEIEHAQGSKLG